MDESVESFVLEREGRKPFRPGRKLAFVLSSHFRPTFVPAVKLLQYIELKAFVLISIGYL